MAVGCNVYLWSAAEQDRLLVECIAKLARELLATGVCARFTCERFDARGPHVMVLFGASPSAEDEVAARLAGAVAEHLACAPSAEAPSAEALAARHAGCKGVALCSVDGEPGLAASGSYRIFDHPEGRYPFALSAGAAAEESIWRLRTELALWAIGRLEAGPSRATAAAVRWTAALDRALLEAGRPRAEHWGYMIERLAPELPRRVARGELTHHGLLSLIGEANRATFERVFHSADVAANGGCDLASLLDGILAEDGRPLAQRRNLLRSTAHITLQLLGVRTGLQLPLLLFAWAGALASEGASPGEASA